VFSTEDVSPTEEKFSGKGLVGHRSRTERIDLNWKQIGVKKIEKLH
jgi:hypothetical protein